ncbi:MAG: SRPBCC family protein [Candidatus Cloacimonetes bacterium]|nr:SRPBCC family protein [Candidatus Cloacimonadota bacterium]
MITIKNSIEINASAEKVFNQLIENISNGESYRLWHPEHVDIRWIKGEPIREGSILHAEEYLDGNLHRLKFRITKIVANRLIAYRALFPLSIIATGNFFRIVSTGENQCIFFSEGHIRFPLWLFNKVHKSHAGKLIASEKHMKEEGENIKKAVEE